jgi:hypothetical protein
MSEILQPQTVARLLSYEAETGELFWLSRDAEWFSHTPDPAKYAKTFNSRFSGKPAFTAYSNGYLHGAIFGRLYRAHRVAWAIAHGYWPDCVDHLNGVRDDNRLENLRDVTKRDNALNQTLRLSNVSGKVGVTWFARDEKWRASGRAAGKCTNLGHFDRLEDAIACRERFEAENGYHPNHGKPRQIHKASGAWVEQCAVIRGHRSAA